MRPPRAALPVLLALAAITGCGSDSDEVKQSNGVESKSPQQILAESATALGRVESFHLEGTQGGSDLRADVGPQGTLRVDVKEDSAAASIIVLNDSLYLRANADFWEKQDETADELADRWFKMPASAREFRDLTEDLTPDTLSYCLPKDHGTLSKGGTATVDGEPAVVIVDKGDRPGSSPGKLFVATEGEPLPLRITGTDKKRPGGERDPRCEDDSADTGEPVDVTFSAYNEPLDIKAPPSAVELGPGTAS